MTLYRKILKQAWQISWQNKYLWFFGLFAALLINGTEYNIVASCLGRNEAANGFWMLAKWFGQSNLSAFLGNLTEAAKSDPATFVKILVVWLVILLLFLVLVWLAVVSQAALVKMAADIVSGKKGSFQEGVEAGMGYFWPVLGVNAITKIVVMAGIALISLPVYLTAGRPAAWPEFVYITLFTIMIILAFSFSFLMKYATAFIVIKKETLFRAIGSGWKLFAANWLISLETTFTLFAISFGLTITLMLLGASLLIPFAILAYVFIAFGMAGFFWLIFSLAIVMLAALIMFGGALLSAFQASAWTTLFVELVSRGGTSKLERLVSQIVGKK